MDSNAPSVDSNADQRLDSWKAIARYLNCDERTARRWEDQEGLPVHRHLHNRKATVFAWRAEVDEWMASRVVEAPGPRQSLPVAALAGVGAFTVSAAVMGLYSMGGPAGDTGKPAPVHAVSLSVQPLSHSRKFGSIPRIGGGRVVWAAFDDGDGEIVVHADGGNLRLTDNAVDDLDPDVSESRVVWRRGPDCEAVAAGPPLDCEIMVHDGTRTQRLTHDGILDGHPRTAGDLIVWSREDEIVLHDGRTLIQLTDNHEVDIDPDTDGYQVIWAGHDGHDFEIFLYDGVTTTQLTDNEVSDRMPSIDGPTAAWIRAGPNTTRLVRWQAGREVAVEQSGQYDWWPSLSGDLVAWIRDQQIHVFDGQAAIRLTDSRGRLGPPDIDGNEIVWTALQGGEFIVFKARYLGTQSVIARP